MYNQRTFESSLTKGTVVTVKWVKDGKQFSAAATVSKMNKASIVVELNHKIGSFQTGYRITVPRSGTGRWTTRECVLPLSLFAGKST